jgi:hypothetical protein
MWTLVLVIFLVSGSSNGGVGTATSFLDFPNEPQGRCRSPPRVYPNELRCLSPLRVTMIALAVGGIGGLEVVS